MWWRSMSTLSFQWTSPGYWQKHSDVWSSLIRVISLSHAKNKITWIISMFLNLKSLSYWCCSDFRLIPMTANFASPHSLSTITRWLFQIFITYAMIIITPWLSKLPLAFKQAHIFIIFTITDFNSILNFRTAIELFLANNKTGFPTNFFCVYFQQDMFWIHFFLVSY